MFMNDVDDRHIMQLIGLLFAQAHRRTLRDGMDGLRPSQYRVLDGVPEKGGVTITELAERVGMTKQAIGQFVTELAKRGYVVTGNDPVDRRVRLVSRTPLGNSALQRLSKVLDGLERDWGKRIGEKRYQEFRRVLGQIVAGA